MSLSVPPFPPDDDYPSPQRMANHLVCALPEPDRKTGLQRSTEAVGALLAEAGKSYDEFVFSI